MTPPEPHAAIAHLFVYGTLRPGEVRWPILSPFVAGDGVDDTVTGTLHDSGLGYPAARFGGAGTIRGRVYPLAPERLATALAVLDDEEGSVAGAFRRVAVTTATGVIAWAYEYGGGLSLSPIEGGDWLAR